MKKSENGKTKQKNRLDEETSKTNLEVARLKTILSRRETENTIKFFCGTLGSERV